MKSSKSSWISQPRLDVFTPVIPGFAKPTPIVAPPKPSCVPFRLPRPIPGETHVGTGVDSDPAHPSVGQSTSVQM